MSAILERASNSFGLGVYSAPEAWQILSRSRFPLSRSALQRWVREEVVAASLSGARWDCLSFEDLISLEVIRRLRHAGVSLQAIRSLIKELRAIRPDLQRPLANYVLKTDGARIYAEIHDRFGEATTIEVVGSNRGQAVWASIIESFVTDVSYDESGRPTTWRLHPYIEADPAIQCGAPTVAGTRVPVSSVVANLEDASPLEVADWFGLTLDEVRAVMEYASLAA